MARSRKGFWRHDGSALWNTSQPSAEGSLGSSNSFAAITPSRRAVTSERPREARPQFSASGGSWRRGTGGPCFALEGTASASSVRLHVGKELVEQPLEATGGVFVDVNRLAPVAHGHATGPAVTRRNS